MIMTEHSCLPAQPHPQLGLGVQAMGYQHMGYPVLPLSRGGKIPHRMLGREGGVHHATTDVGWAQYWWGQDPAAGIGVATGNGLLVWDLDVKHGENGPAVFADRLAPWLPCESAAVARTPSGGWHLWMRSALAQVPTRPGIMPGVDAKGDGGYVAVWPSRVVVTAAGPEGGEALLPYEWVSGCPCSLPLVGGEVIAWLASAEATGSRTAIGESGGIDFGQLAATGLQPGSRNVDLYRLACSLYRRFGLSGDGQAAVREMVGRVLARTDLTGFGRAEIERIMQSARDFVGSREQDDARLWQAYGSTPWTKG